LNNNNNFINTNQLSLKGEKSKTTKFTINTISILMTGRTMASIKHDRKNNSEVLNILI
jgi:hypothetical protein